MRFLSILTHSTTLFLLQQIVSIWFLVDFFLARDSTTLENFVQHPNESVEHISKLVAELETKLDAQNTRLKKPPFDKVVLVVIDALGSEFIPSIADRPGTEEERTMPFLEGLIAKQKAIGYVAKATTPTVTMPRIKALVSGTIPSFMDILFNLASDVSTIHQDNILSIAKAHNKSLVFYGDDTWLSLYDRSMFTRFKETYSFYANDYTIVDTNVTEMALPESEQTDWDYLILHYLGLDHIGHVFGSNKSPLVREKLLEMDNVLKQLYHNLASQNGSRTLLVVCGDHGMSKEGNHGGDTQLEVNTAMVFAPINQSLKPLKNQVQQINQIDFAPTISQLTGLPIPRSSKGVLIKHLLASLDSTNQDSQFLLFAALKNLKQLIKLVDSKEFESSDDGKQLIELLSKHKASGQENSISVDECFDISYRIQRQLLNNVTSRSNPLLVVLATLLVMLLTLVKLRKASLRLLIPLTIGTERLLLMLSLVVPIVLQGSTDFIELEQTFWPIFSITVFVLFCLLALKRSPSLVEEIDKPRLVIFIVTYLLTAVWNTTDSTNLFVPLIAILIMCNFTRQNSGSTTGIKAILIFAFGLCVSVAKFYEETSDLNANRIILQSHVALMQLGVLCSLALITFLNLKSVYLEETRQSSSVIQKLATAWMWLVFLLTRSRNYILLIANVVMEASLNSLANSLHLGPLARVSIYLQFSASAFFGQGNTNLFSSLDVKPAFFAQTSYNFYLAVPLVACAAFGAQIYWYAKLFQRFQDERDRELMTSKPSGRERLPLGAETEPIKLENNEHSLRDFIDAKNFLSFAYYMFVCLALANHLFIWSVISPKLVYHYASNLVLSLATTAISLSPWLLTKLSGQGEGKQEIRMRRVI